ncbi:MAG: hypothetical protein V7K31_12120 [Nostoc sp.]
MVNKFNEITSEIKGFKEDLNSHVAMIQEVRILSKDMSSLDKRFDIHAQDYVNNKDANLIAINGVTDQIKHKWERTEEELEKLEKAIDVNRESLLKLFNNLLDKNNV